MIGKRMDESGFLSAIRTDLHEDTPRLAYADWLEERGDPRGEYLRLQCELKRVWSYADPHAELAARLLSLRTQIDPEWLTLAHRCTTPAPPVDVARAIPALRRKARQAVCLHPRPGSAATDASKIGGEFLWPAAESWPTCPEHGCPFVTALQLRKEDVPELGFRRGTDLFQVLWCPNNHPPSFCPAIRVYWRKRAAVKATAPSPAAPSGLQTGYVPRPCVLFPERVVEYPDPFEFDEGFYSKIAASEELIGALELVRLMRTKSVRRTHLKRWGLPWEGAGHLYQCGLSTAAGTKVGGYPDWVQKPAYPACSCGATMQLLVMFASWEFNGVSWLRWLPVEERYVLTDSSVKREKAVCAAAGWMFGDAGNLYLFMCRSCKERPMEYHVQCS
jgi:uncharacterized protein (TIGR02996 family)